MTPVILLLMIATMVTAILAMLSYQRRSGVASGAGRGAPTSPIIPIAGVVVVCLLALLVGVFLRR